MSEEPAGDATISTDREDGLIEAARRQAEQYRQEQTASIPQPAGASPAGESPRTVAA